MAEIRFENVSLTYPVFGASAMSLRNQLVHFATGGVISQGVGNKTFVTALSDISFSIRDGDAVGLVGHNGAGKSTLLRTMAGIFHPSIGKVIRKGRVSTVFEIGAGLQRELTGRENLLIILLMAGRSLKEAKRLVPSIEEFAGLGEFVELPVSTYSSGMLMRLMFSAATAIQPEIFLVDEMVSTGDADFQVRSGERLENLISSSKIIVMASHSKELISRYCNRIFFLEHGVIREITMADYLQHQ